MSFFGDARYTGVDRSQNTAVRQHFVPPNYHFYNVHTTCLYYVVYSAFVAEQSRAIQNIDA